MKKNMINLFIMLGCSSLANANDSIKIKTDTTSLSCTYGIGGYVCGTLGSPTPSEKKQVTLPWKFQQVGNLPVKTANYSYGTAFSACRIPVEVNIQFREFNGSREVTGTLKLNNEVVDTFLKSGNNFDWLGLSLGDVFAKDKCPEDRKSGIRFSTRIEVL
jgi:hypothetical protein